MPALHCAAERRCNVCSSYLDPDTDHELPKYLFFFGRCLLAYQVYTWHDKMFTHSIDKSLPTCSECRALWRFCFTSCGILRAQLLTLPSTWLYNYGECDVETHIVWHRLLLLSPEITHLCMFKLVSACTRQEISSRGRFFAWKFSTHLVHMWLMLSLVIPCLNVTGLRI